MKPVEPFDVTKPNIARVYDYLLGGKDNFAADREAAAQLLASHPLAAELARENRTFLTQAVRYVAGQGIGQFVDVGCGLPTSPNTHELAREEQPAARVAYVDNDPMVISHTKNLLAKDGGIAVIGADLRDSEPLLANPELTAVIDMDQPVCVLLVSVLHFVDLETARAVTAALTAPLASGSYLVISVGRTDPEFEAERGRAVYTPSAGYNHSVDEVRSLFGDFEFTPPGVVEARSWRPGQPPLPHPARPMMMLAGVARKP